MSDSATNPQSGGYPQGRTLLRGGALLLLPALFMLGCSSTSQPQAAPLPKTRAVFIGNSLTYTNNLPAIIQGLAAAAGTEPFTYRMIAYGGFALEDHWGSQESHATIAQGEWDVVILQQGMSASIEGESNLKDYAGRYADEIRKAGGVPALYSVWPPEGNPELFDRVRESYGRAATAADALLFPVGEAWRAAWRRDSTIRLYSSDGVHPTVEGSYLAALVIFQQLYHRSVIGLPASITLPHPWNAKVEIPPATAAILQQAAAEANEKYARR